MREMIGQDRGSVLRFDPEKVKARNDAHIMRRAGNRKRLAATVTLVALISCAWTGDIWAQWQPENSPRVTFYEALAKGFPDQAAFDELFEELDQSCPDLALLLCILFPWHTEAHPLMYARIFKPSPVTGGTQGGGSQDTDTDTTRDGSGGEPTEEPVVRGGEGGDAPARVVFQSALPAMPDYPVCFSNSPGILVRTVMVAAVGDAADLATLIDAPETARIRVAAEGGAMPPMTAQEASLTSQFTPAQWIVAEVDFGEPVPLGSLRFGDTAGRPLWGRVWQGEIAEVVCFGASPDADVRAGVANYLSVRGNFHGHPATYAQKKAAIEAGLKYGLVWGTVIIVK